MSKTVREWLQTEVWSTRTSKKIVGIALSIVLVLSGVIWLYRDWTNPAEILAARDMLQKARSVRAASEADYKSEVVQAEASEKLAEQKSWTFRDSSVEGQVSGTLGMAELCRDWELHPIPLGLKKDELAAQQAQMSRLICMEYEISERTSRHLLNTKLGF